MQRLSVYLVLTALPVMLAAADGPQPIPLPADTSVADATDINARGDIVGWRFFPTLPCPPNTSCSGNDSFLVRAGGAPEMFVVPGSSATFAQGINARGDIVGQYFDGGWHGFLRDRAGTFTTIDFPGEPLTTLTGINASGTIIGYYIHDIEQEEATAFGFILDRGVFHPLPRPDMRPRAIAEDGTVIGNLSDFSGFHGFILRGDEFTLFDCPGATFTELHDVLPDGRLLGVMLRDFVSPVEGFVSTGSTCESLGAGVYAEGMNARGTIVGQLFGPAGGGPFVWRR